MRAIRARYTSCTCNMNCVYLTLPFFRYDPYLQTRHRVEQLRQLGHSVDKVTALLEEYSTVV